MHDTIPPNVAEVFDACPHDVRSRLLELRRLILDTAETIGNVGPLEETLKWGEPSYLTPVTKTGSTVRINRRKGEEDKVGLYFKCTANLVPTFREHYPELDYEGDRCVILDVNDELPLTTLRQCIAMALTYHRNKHLPASERWAMMEPYGHAVSG